MGCQVMTVRKGQAKSRKDGAFTSPRFGATAAQSKTLSKLYDTPIASSRSGAVFNAHSYPTKINTAPVVTSILAHTQPGDLVLDGFAGSGVTALSTVLCDQPDAATELFAHRVLGSVQWGPRDCVSYDISPLACFIADCLLNPPDVNAFENAANEVLDYLRTEWGWLYAAEDNTGEPADLRHIIWSDYIICPNCSEKATYWELAVDLELPKFNSEVSCKRCRKSFNVSGAEHATERYFDDLLSKPSTRRRRIPVQVYGRSGSKLWKRAPLPSDLRLIKKIEEVKVPECVPVLPMMNMESGRWGELYRSGYHQGITHVHHFYTRRNLIAVAAAWTATEKYPAKLQKALRFWISSYNHSHSTLMSRVVCKESSKELVLTSGQPGALYISSLPVEKNVFAGLKGKLPLVKKAFETLSGRRNNVSIRCASSLNLDMEDSSVDYIFIDPPFGDNIQYAEVNFISEAWIGQHTKAREEAIVSSFTGKSIDDYCTLLTHSFKEFYRVLKNGHFMTVVFHSTTPAVWNALRTAWETAGFDIVETSVLDKKQTSFKQTTTEGAVHGDCLILLGKRRNQASSLKSTKQRKDLDPWKLVEDRIRSFSSDGTDTSERTKQRLYNRLVAHYLEAGQSMPLDAQSFFDELPKRFRCRNNRFYLK